MRKFRVHAVLLVFVLVVSVGLGLIKFRDQNQIVEPLLEELEKIVGIEKAEIEVNSLKQGDRRLINLTLDPNYPLAYTIEIAKQSLANYKGNFVVALLERPSLELWNVWQKVQLAAEEALITGEFVELEKRVEHLAERGEIDWELAIDQEHIYLRLQRGGFIIQRALARHDGGDIIIINQGGID